MSSVPTELLRPHLERVVERAGSVRAFADNHKHLGVHERMVWTVLSGEYKTVTMSTADKLVTAVNPMLWHTLVAPGMAKQRRPTGTAARLTEAELRAVWAEHHASGASLQELATANWEKWGYATVESAAKSLSARMRRLGLRVNRPRNARYGVRSRQFRSPSAKLTVEQVRNLHRIYVETGCSMLHIANMVWESFGYASPRTCETSIYMQFRKYGLPTRGPGGTSRIPAEEWPNIVERYMSGVSVADISRSRWEDWGYACARDAERAVNRLLSTRGVPRRNRSEISFIRERVKRETSMRKVAA